MIEIRRSALVRFTPEQMFDLVNDVEAYPKRFNWCASSAVIERDGNVLEARLDLNFAGLRHSFSTRNTAEPPRRIDIRLVGGPFRSLDGVWTFDHAGCRRFRVIGRGHRRIGGY